jgi:HEAT repeat protein
MEKKGINMQTLDQKLTAIEPVLRYSDETSQFSHPSFQDVLTAKQFADEINGGKLSLREAYLNYWSCSVNSTIWNLAADKELRVLLPAWTRNILFLEPMLSLDDTQELLDIIIEGFRIAQSDPNTKDVNPFYSEIETAARIVISSNKKSMLKTDYIANNIIPEHLSGSEQEYLNILPKFCSDAAMHALIKDLEKRHFLAYDRCAYILKPFGAARIKEALEYNKTIGARVVISLIEKYEKEDSNDKSSSKRIKQEYKHSRKQETLSQPQIDEIRGVILAKRDINKIHKAMEKLAKSRNVDAMNALINYYKNEKDILLRNMTMESIHWSIRDISKNKEVMELVTDFLIDYVMQRANEYLIDQSKGYAISTLGLIGTPKSVDALVSCLLDTNTKSESKKDAAEALATLGYNGNKKAIDALIKCLDEENTDNDSLVYSLIIGLRNVRNNKTIDALSRYRARNGRHRTMATEALSYIGTPYSVRAIIESLKKGEIRESDIEEIGKLKSKELAREAEPYLLEYLYKMPLQCIHRVAETLAEMGSKEAGHYIAQCMLDKDNKYKYRLVDAASKIGTEECGEALTEFLKDVKNIEGIPRVAQSAVNGLGKLGNENAIPVLKRLLELPDIDYRKSIYCALDSISRRMRPATFVAGK